MKRILAAAAIAAATIATLSLTVPGTASAGTTGQAATGHVFRSYTKTMAGYEMTGGGWRFRYIKTTLTVPGTNQASWAFMVLGGKAGSVNLYVNHEGGISYKLSAWDYEYGIYVAPSVGDKITLSIYYDRQTQKVFITAVNLNNGHKATVALGVKSWVFTRARLTAGGPDWTTWNFASKDTRLWAFTDTTLTSYSGYRGAIFGPWNTTRIIGTRTGTSAGKVVLWPTWPWNNAHNFGVWWRAAS
jgi:hypothetical protein